MKNVTKKVALSLVAALVLGAAGCQWRPMQMTRASDDKPAPAGEPAAPAVPAPAPAVSKAPEGPTPVEQALELSQKLKQSFDDLAAARKENKDLVERNAKLTTQTAQATMELNQARKELDEANAMLREMQTELAKWKTDIMGYRDEMRAAQMAQLEALRRVLKLLGADDVPVAAVTRPSEPAAAPAPGAPAPIAPAPAAPVPAATATAPASPQTGIVVPKSTLSPVAPVAPAGVRQ